MASPNMLDNLIPYLFIICTLIVIVIVILLFNVFPCLRDKIKKFLIDKYEKTKFNGAIRSITAGFLKISMGVSL